MKKILEGKNGQNVMSFYGLQLIKDTKRPYVSVGSIRNVMGFSGDEVKQALKDIRVREHRILVTWASRKFHTTCIRLKDLPAVDKQLGGKLPDGLVEDLFNEYRKLL